MAHDGAVPSPLSSPGCAASTMSCSEKRQADWSRRSRAPLAWRWSRRPRVAMTRCRTFLPLAVVLDDLDVCVGTADFGATEHGGFPGVHYISCRRILRNARNNAGVFRPFHALCGTTYFETRRRRGTKTPGKPGTFSIPRASKSASKLSKTSQTGCPSRRMVQATLPARRGTLVEGLLEARSHGLRLRNSRRLRMTENANQSSAHGSGVRAGLAPPHAVRRRYRLRPHRRPLTRRGGFPPPASPASIPPSLMLHVVPLRTARGGLGSHTRRICDADPFPAQAPYPKENIVLFPCLTR